MKLEFEFLLVDDFLSRCKLPRILTRPRKYLEISSISPDLVQSIQTHGVILPIVVDRDYVIIDGVKRYVVIKYLREQGVKIPEPVPVLRLVEESFQEKPISALHIAYILNKFRAPPEDTEFSEELLIYMQDIAYKVWEIYNKDYEKTAKHLGFSVDLVRKLIEEYLRSMQNQ